MTKRLNIVVPESLHRAAKVTASQEGKTLQAWVVAAIERGVEAKKV